MTKTETASELADWLDKEAAMRTGLAYGGVNGALPAGMREAAAELRRLEEVEAKFRKVKIVWAEATGTMQEADARIAELEEELANRTLGSQCK